MRTGLSLYEEPPRVSIHMPDQADGARNALLLGLFWDDDGLQGLLCNEGGEILTVGTWAFTIDYRYDAQTDRWMDKDAPEAAQEG